MSVTGVLMSTVKIIRVKLHTFPDPWTYPIEENILHQFAGELLDDAVKDGNLIEWKVIDLASEIKEDCHGTYDEFRLLMAEIVLGLS